MTDNSREYRFALFVLVISLLSFPATGQDYARVGQPIATVFPPSEHGGHNQNWSSFEADNGLIYVAHTTGVSQWDGEHWRNLATPGDTPVRAVCQWSGDGRIYAGATNDLGVFRTDERNTLVFRSLLPEWSFDDRQFGEVWSIACVDAGVLFVTNKAVYWWDGQQVVPVPQMPVARYRLFAIDGAVYFKRLEENILRRVQLSESGAVVSDTKLTLPASDRLVRILRNRKDRLVAVMMDGGVFEESDDAFELVLSPTAIASVPVYNAMQGSDGTYYLAGLYDGLFILNESFEPLRHYREQDGISMDALFSVSEDRQGTLWLTGVPNVVRFAPPHIVSRFKAGATSTEIIRLEPTQVGLIAVGNALFRLSNADEPMRPPSFEIFTQSRDIYVDALADGERLLYAGLQGIFSLPLDDLESPPVRLIEAGLCRSLRLHPVSGALYAACDRGLFRLGEGEGAPATLIPGTADVLDSMEIAPDGVIWLGTATQKLYRVVDRYPEAGTADVLRLGPEDGLPLGAVTPFVWQGAVVFGTADGVLEYRPDQRPRLVRLDTGPQMVRQSPAAPVIFSEDRHAAMDRLWYQTGSTALAFDRRADDHWQSYGHVFARFNGNRTSHLLITARNEAWQIENKDAIHRFDVDAALSPPPAGRLNVRGVIDQRSGTVISPSGANLSLTPTNNSIRIRYALADSASGREAEYRHRLLGSENERWSDWSTQPSADYTTLSGGAYRFEVQARDAWGRVIDTGFSFPVAPPWYWSKMALVLYVLLGLVLLVATSWLTQRWRTAKLTRANEALEQVVAERTRDVERQAAELREQQILKDRFFGNVSHEFRTPLTLTIGPLETLVAEHEKTLSAPAVQLANTALDNAQRMLALVGQVLDLNRLDAGKLSLRVGQYDLAALVKRVHGRFEAWAREHDQALLIEGCEEPVERWFDEDQVDRCLYNLVSNAIKYSGEGSRIVLRLVVDAERTGVQVTDDGVGIAPDDQESVFERYVQGTASERVTTPGTGIGLALVKEVMELHRGQVTLDSDQGKGSTFSLWLRNGRSHFDNEQVMEPIYAPQPVAFEDDPREVAAAGARNGEDRTTLLIVDDNRELLNFMSLRLSATYRIVQASNGERGFETACRELPDLIISDVMMPVMTGLEMVQKLKDTPATRTIPVILLTARATKRETVEGFVHGADDYLTKPFDTSELIVRVNAQIAGRKALRETFMREARARPVPATARASFEERFAAVVECHMGESDLNVKALARHLNISTDTLTRRCKKEFGQTPLAALTRARLDRATVLLRDGQLTVSEVGYSVGFESLAYFSRRYKQFTGVNPSNVLRRSEDG